ncbi:MAG: hypothetical protein J3K34DRAFT_412912 [Monoraphidium minutum]|nr:MAG: hypothetical protein J3K34DRAFT_412912 [Monoraphidium minutum]
MREVNKGMTFSARAAPKLAAAAGPSSSSAAQSYACAASDSSLNLPTWCCFDLQLTLTRHAHVPRSHVRPVYWRPDAGRSRSPLALPSALARRGFETIAPAARAGAGSCCHRRRRCQACCAPSTVLYEPSCAGAGGPNSRALPRLLRTDVVRW